GRTRFATAPQSGCPRGSDEVKREPHRLTRDSWPCLSRLRLPPLCLTNPVSDELRARYERLNLLYQVSNVIHSTLEPREALKLILGEAVRLMRASSGSVALFNPTTGFLEIDVSHGLPPNALQLRLRLGEGITGWVARAGKPARVGDVSKDSRYIMVQPNVRSELAVPLEASGQVRG